MLLTGAFQALYICLGQVPQVTSDSSVLSVVCSLRSSSVTEVSKQWTLTLYLYVYHVMLFIEYSCRFDSHVLNTQLLHKSLAAPLLVAHILHNKSPLLNSSLQKDSEFGAVVR